MGTRNIVAVVVNGEYRVAQYGQWDGYPSGQGRMVRDFLGTCDLNVLREKCLACSWYTKEESAAIDNEIDEGYKASRDYKWEDKYPALNRDQGAKILKMVYESPNGLKLNNSIDFAADSLMCEYVWVVDLDKNTFEMYAGFNKTGNTVNERFSHLPIRTDYKHCEQYYQVRFVKSWPLDALPTKEELEDLNNFTFDPVEEDDEE